MSSPSSSCISQPSCCFCRSTTLPDLHQSPFGHPNHPLPPRYFIRFEFCTSSRVPFTLAAPSIPPSLHPDLSQPQIYPRSPLGFPLYIAGQECSNHFQRASKCFELSCSSPTSSLFVCHCVKKMNSAPGGKLCLSLFHY